jgi:hypothetical protein
MLSLAKGVLFTRVPAAVGREVEAARAELAAAQLRLSVASAEAAAGQAGAAEVRRSRCHSGLINCHLLEIGG